MRAASGREIGGRRWSAATLASVAGLALAMVAPDARAAHEVFTTISGLPVAPASERTLRPRADGVAIRFRAPAAVRLATVWTHWRDLDPTCTAALHADDAGRPGAALAAPVALAGDGWAAADVDVALLPGEPYHVVLRCAERSAARLTYVLDAHGTDHGAWSLEDLGRARRRSSRAAPLFALRFSDDTWWGQPYRGDRRRATVRVCGGDELRQTIVPPAAMEVRDVRIPVDGEPVSLGWELSLPGTTTAHAGAPAVLQSGTPYRVHLRQGEGRCLRQATLVTDLDVGRPFAGVETRALEASDDRGATWRPLVGTLGIALMVEPAPPPPAGPVCGDGVRAGAEQCDGAADAACPGRCAAACTCTPAPACGDGVVQGDEACDGAADAACPGRCTAGCACAPPAPVCGDGLVNGGEACDGDNDAACPGRCTATCACAPPPPVCGDGVVNGEEACDGAADAACPGRCTGTCACAPPAPACGDGVVQGEEACDGGDDAACPGRCTDGCACAPAPACGDGIVNGGETCDGAADDACPGRCTSDCACADPAPPPRAYKSIYGSGYYGVYDSQTYALWPSRLGLILGGADVQGPMIRDAKKQAAEAGNHDATFVFYLSLTDMDSRCNCLDQRLYDGFKGKHPEWILRNASGGMVSTNNGIGRLFATDIGNMAYIDHWADFALAEAERHGWDGVWADNIFRGYFGEWSAAPINPRTRKPYTTREYRDDMLRALKRLRERFHARGKIVVGNHTQSWQPDVFADPVQREAITTMDGVEIEDCVFSYGGSRAYGENDVLAQLRYLDYANRNGVMTICRAFTTSAREYPLAFYLLTKEGMSQIAQLNGAGQWKSDMTTDLGAPAGGFWCLDPNDGYRKTSDCPSAGKVLGRDWTKGRVLVNPSASASRTVPLGGAFRRNGGTVTSVTLGPRSGVILLKP